MLLELTKTAASWRAGCLTCLRYRHVGTTMVRLRTLIWSIEMNRSFEVVVVIFLIPCKVLSAHCRASMLDRYAYVEEEYMVNFGS